MSHSIDPALTPPLAMPHIAYAQEPSFVGRDREIALLRGQLDAALAGQGSLVLISGGAGLGKTTLAEFVAREAAGRGALVLTGRCYDLTETPPYGPWLELARRYPAAEPDLPPLPPVLAQSGGIGESASQEALFATIQGFLVEVTARRPVLLWFDDLHWSDPASLDLLRRVGREVGQLPLLLVATYRGEEVGRQHPLSTHLPLLVREARARRLELQPLDSAALRALIGARYALPAGDLERLVAYLQARAEGNPFFLGELLRALEDERLLRRTAPAGAEARWEFGDVSGVGLPVLLRQVLDRRLARLEADDHGLLAVAAVIGQEVPLAVWAAAGLIGEEALLGVIERAVEARLLEVPDDGLTVRFSHALLREAFYASLLPPRRRVWHRRIGEALLAQPAPDPDAVAYHFRQAGDARASEWLVRAGERAQRAYAWLSAAERYEAALALRDPADPDAEGRARLLICLAQLRRYTDPDRGIASLEEAERLADAAGAPALAASSRFDRGHLRCMAKDFARGLAEMEAGLDTLEGLPSEERRASPTLAILGVPADEQEQYHQGVLLLFFAVLGRLTEARIISAALDRQAHRLSARAALGRGWLQVMLGQPDQARQSFVDAGVAYGDQHWEVGTTLLYELEWVVLPYATDRPAERQRLAQEAERAWTRASGALGDLSPHLARLPLLLVAGHWAEARALALATLATTQSNEQWRLYPRRILALIARAQGDAELAWQLVREVLPEGPETQPGERLFLEALTLQWVAVLLALDAADLPTARAWLEAHDHWLTWSGAVLGRAEGQLGWAAYQRAAGDLALAREHATQALELAAGPRQPLALLVAHRTLGEIETATERYTDAAGHVDAALTLADACAAPYERALTLLALVELRRATGERATLEPLLAEARALLEPLGARPALALADALAPRQVPLPAGGLPDGLTVREAEVLALIATGQSNQEIADELNLSVRTVERHINNLYHKIDARGRADATAYAARHGFLSD